MSAINLTAFVADALDHEEFASQDEAYEAIERRLAIESPRALSAHERARVGLAVALAWNARYLHTAGV